MKQLLFIPIFIFAYMVTASSQEKTERFLSLNYGQKIYFVDFWQYIFIESPAPLTNNARFHGMNIQAAISKNIIIGLYANGSLKDNKNLNGYTNWGGGLGCFTAVYRIKDIAGVFADFGFGLGCGRFNYSSSSFDGTFNESVFSDYIFFEPKLNIGYIFKEKLILTLEVSYILRLSGNEYYVGNNNLPSAFPSGLFFGGTVGYQFPIFKF